MGMATIIADNVEVHISSVRSMAHNGNLTDAELCRWFRKMLNQASKELTVEIKDLESE